MATWLEDVRSGLENLGGVAPLSKIYAAVRSLRTPPHPQSFEAIIRRTLESNSSDSDAFNGANDEFYSAKGIGGGVWGLRSSLASTPIAVDAEIPSGVEEPSRNKRETYRILRDTRLARQLKKLHNGQCQLCGDSIILTDGSAYSEAHHLKPLGSPHYGPDTPANIIVLCPNHHVMLDYGVISLTREGIREHENHKIGEEFIRYHNYEVHHAGG